MCTTYLRGTQQFITSIDNFNITGTKHVGNIVYAVECQYYKYLSQTPLIYDIINIILTYTNDELNIEYVIVKDPSFNSNYRNTTTFYFTISGIIAYREYVFCCSFFFERNLKNDYESLVYISKNSNITTSNMNEYSQSTCDREYSLYLRHVFWINENVLYIINGRLQFLDPNDNNYITILEPDMFKNVTDAMTMIHNIIKEHGEKN